MRLILGISAFLAVAACDHTDADLEYARGVCAKIGTDDMQGCVERQFAERQAARSRLAAATIMRRPNTY